MSSTDLTTMPKPRFESFQRYLSLNLVICADTNEVLRDMQGSLAIKASNYPQFLKVPYVHKDEYHYGLIKGELPAEHHGDLNRQSRDKYLEAGRCCLESCPQLIAFRHSCTLDCLEFAQLLLGILQVVNRCIRRQSF